MKTLYAIMILAGLASGRGTVWAALVDDRAAAARGAIEETEVRQREVLSSLYVIDRDLGRAQRAMDRLAQRARAAERDAQALAREVHTLESASADRGRQMNSRLGSLYRRRAHVNTLSAIFAAETPAQVDRQHHFLRLLIDDDRRRVDAFVEGLREARRRRETLAKAVRKLVSARRDARAAELALNERRAERAAKMAEIRARRDTNVATLRSLREAGVANDLAFFERRGQLPSPVRARVDRTFGTIDDPRWGFHLSHRGWFYGAPSSLDVSAVAGGIVTVAREVPGWGPTVVVDHGGHYHSVYSGAARIKVREGERVEAGTNLAATGPGSPLFGPGLYFELRHFADAVDPRHWIKDAEFSAVRASAGVN